MAASADPFNADPRAVFDLLVSTRKEQGVVDHDRAFAAFNFSELSISAVQTTTVSLLRVLASQYPRAFVDWRRGASRERQRDRTADSLSSANKGVGDAVGETAAGDQGEDDAFAGETLLHYFCRQFVLLDKVWDDWVGVGHWGSEKDVMPLLLVLLNPSFGFNLSRAAARVDPADQTSTDPSALACCLHQLIDVPDSAGKLPCDVALAALADQYGPDEFEVPRQMLLALDCLGAGGQQLAGAFSASSASTARLHPLLGTYVVQSRADDSPYNQDIMDFPLEHVKCKFRLLWKERHIEVRRGTMWIFVYQDSPGFGRYHLESCIDISPPVAISLVKDRAKSNEVEFEVSNGAGKRLLSVRAGKGRFSRKGLLERLEHAQSQQPYQGFVLAVKSASKK